MGDRALIQLKNDDECSPTLYLHWSGSEAPQIIDGWARQMGDRIDDMAYGFARLVGRACNANGGDEQKLSVGVFFDSNDELTEEDSHGDAGCFVVDVTNKKVHQFGGYAPAIPKQSILDWKTEFGIPELGA